MEVKYNITIISLIGSISIYSITSSLLTPLISIILEHRKVETTIIGVMAMIAPAGLIIGAFFVSKWEKAIYDRPEEVHIKSEAWFAN